MFSLLFCHGRKPTAHMLVDSLLIDGQTGTGKTHTMGILERVTPASTGIVPRALSHVFGHIAQHSATTEFVVTASFVQIYLETLQDLLAPDLSPTPSDSGSNNNGHGGGGGGGGSGGGGGNSHRLTAVDPLSLRIREDPVDGFFVEGVTKYNIASYEDAVELVNF